MRSFGNRKSQKLKRRRLGVLLLALSLVLGSSSLYGCGGMEMPYGIADVVDVETQNEEETAVEESVQSEPLEEIADSTDTEQASKISDQYDFLPQEGEFYYDVENVVLYLELYHELPLNYITKKEAQKRGWEGGSVEDYVEDAAIGGDYFGNYEGILPEGDYKECDIDTHNYKNRGSRRLIYSDEGEYYYTKDHYESFSEVTVDENYKVTIHNN